MSANYAIERIEPLEGETRRMAEQRTVSEMARRIFGNDATIAHTRHGAPYIVGRTTFVSVSHSLHFAALAWSDTNLVGIDIEEMRLNQLSRVANKFLNSSETDIYSGERLIEAWTLKEAAFKATENASPDLRLYRLPLDGERRDIIQPPSGTLHILFSGPVADAAAWLSIVEGRPQLAHPV